MVYLSLILIIFGVIFYQLLEKTISKRQNVYLYLVYTYATAFICIIVGLFITKYDFNNIFKDINIQSALVGVAAMIADYGLILSYRKGWKMSTLNITYTICVLIILLIIDISIMHEKITDINLAGIILCLISIIFLNHKSQRRIRRT